MIQAVIMAGGEGTRLRPLTCDRPKPMVPVLNKPVMEYTVELLKKHGITDIGVTLQYMPWEISNYFRDGSDHAVNIQYFIEETPLGTAGSVKNALGFLEDTFIVISGDGLTDFNLTEAINFHREKGAIATLILTPVEIPLEYGVVITEKTGEIRQFLEKPGWGEVFSDTVNTGIYVLEPEALDYVPPGQKFDFSKDLFPFLLKEKKPLFGISLRGYWCDIGNLNQYLDAQYQAMEGRVSIQIRGLPGEDRVYFGENCQVHPGAQIKGPAVIGDNCYIGRDAVVGPYTVIGSSCRIDEGASLKKSILWNGAYIGRRSEIRGAVICSKAMVKDRAMVFEGAVIGDGGVLEEEAKVRPDVKVWPNKTVEKGTVLDTHLVWGARACRSLFGADGISGKVNVNLTPECAAKLGAVFGNVTGPGSKILVSSDHSCSSQMIKMAVQSGLMSAGISVFDGGSLVTPVHRHAVRALGVKGGIHIKSSSKDPDILHLNFFTGSGSVIGRDMERKIENQFERDDFQRSSKEHTGEILYMPGLTESYIRSVLKNVSTDVIRDRRYRVVTYFTGECMQAVVPEIFNRLGCELINCGIGSEPDGPREPFSIAESLAGEVTGSGASIGAVLDNNGERVVLIDELGNVINKDLFEALMSLIILEKSSRPVVAAPVTASGVVERLAMSRNGRVVRTKTSASAFLEEASKPEITGAQGRLNQSILAFDALSTLVMILEYMAEKNKSLSQVVSEIPDFYMARKQSECPWPLKGKVMRELIEENRGRKVELIDGIKIYHENGWALVLPDAEEPRYHVFSEGFSHEFAESLADFYLERINQLKN